MTAPDHSLKRQIPLAPRAPSIHGTERQFAAPHQTLSAARGIRDAHSCGPAMGPSEKRRCSAHLLAGHTRSHCPPLGARAMITSPFASSARGLSLRDRGHFATVPTCTCSASPSASTPRGFKSALAASSSIRRSGRSGPAQSGRSLYRQCGEELRIPGFCRRLKGTLSAPRVQIADEFCRLEGDDPT
jgi:hypothetical protein